VTTEQLVADVLEVAAIPAPTFAEEARLDWLDEHLISAPGQRSRDAAGNLVWRWGDDWPELAVLAHVDTVFPAETPLSFRREDGRLIGPGIGDNAAAVVVALHAVSEFLGEQPARPGALVFTVGEEGLGNLSGAIAACEGLQPAAVVAVEGHGLERVLVDAVGSARVRIRVEGPGGHSWVDRGRPSAVHGLLALGQDLLAYATPEHPVNLGTISGGQSVNTIAGEAELVAEMRSLDEEPLDAFVAAADSLAVQEPLAVAVDGVGRRPAGRLDRASPLLAAVRSVRRDLGLPDELEAGSTDANAALARAIPAVALGCSYGQGMHTTGEWIEADALKLGLRQLAGVLERVLAA
jgi:acetylornithine deacetylase/succinyl-diaminopimelate desuccinylase-like protein